MQVYLLYGYLFPPFDFSNRLHIDKNKWMDKVESVLIEATLVVPRSKIFMQTGGKEGVHSEKMGFILAEMQYLQRVHPGAAW